LEQQPKRQQVTKARIFGDDDQIEFARLTGDFNPIHLDPVAARRTLAGAPVVHGIHSLLWLLDVIAPDFLSKTIASLQVKFIRMLYVGETATAAISRGSETSLWLKIRVGSTDTLHATVVFGERLRKPLFSEPSLEAALAPTRPNELRLNEMEGQSGTLAFAHPRTELAHTFPRASQWIGEQRIAAIGCTTRLVGMVLPGLHSLYNNLNVMMIEGGEADNALAFRSEHVDPRFRLVRVAVSGGGISGRLRLSIGRCRLRRPGQRTFARWCSRTSLLAAPRWSSGVREASEN